MKQIFKFYIFLIVVFAVSLFTYFLFVQPFYIDLSGIMFMLITIYLEYNNILDEQNSLLISLTGCSYIFLTINYGIYPAIIAYLIALLANAVIKYRDLIKIVDMKKRYRKQQEKIRHKDQAVKITFNVSKQVITTALIYFSSSFLNISYVGVVDIWKIVLIYLLMLIAENFIMILVIVLNTGKLPKDLLSISRISPLAFYDMIMCIVLIYSYRDRGVAGALLVYLILFPLQKTTLMYYKVKIQEGELFTDSLTNAYNLRFFEELLFNKLKNKETFSLIMLDLDKFKEINDKFGHLVGDKALIEFSRIMQKKIVKKNYFCRYAGDEFIIVIRNYYEADDIAHQILNLLNDFTFDYEGNKIKILLSIGIYHHKNTEKNDIEDIIKKVDKAMYHSKKLGGNNITCYDNLL
jgi:diguanylate cyclase (GGDEF)-like protein